MKWKLPHLYRLGIRFPKTVLFFSLCFAALGIHHGSKLDIESDFAALLPKDTPSIQSLNHVKDFFGGSSYLFLTVEGEDASLADQFATQFEEKILEHSSVFYVDYKKPVDFFKKRFWYYLESEDLNTIEKRIDQALVLEKKGVSSTFSDLMDFADPEERPNLQFDDIFNKYTEKLGSSLQETISDKEGAFLVLRVKLKDQAEDLDSSRRVLEDIERIEKNLKSDPRYQKVKVGYTGSYQTRAEQLSFIQNQIKWVSAVVGLALFVILLLYFRKIRSAIFVSIPLLISLIWTGELIYLFLGHLNVITGFGIAILGGLGSDYGIYLLSRYDEERIAGTDFELACERTFTLTGRATYGSMITTVGSFLALLLSKFGVFVEFGAVGAMGVLSTYLAMILVLPAILALTKSWETKKVLKESPLVLFSKTPLFMKIFKPRTAMIGIVVVLIGVSFFSIPSQKKIYFSEGGMENKDLPGKQLYDRVSNLMNATLNPTVLLVQGEENEKRLVSTLMDLMKNKPEEEILYRDVLGATRLVPTNVETKRIQLKRISEKMVQLQRMVKSYQKALLESLNDSIQSSSIGLQDLPKEVKRIFVSAHDPHMFAVYLYPSIDRGQPEETNRYRNVIEKIRSDIGIPFEMADGGFVISDTVSMIQKEAPRGLAFILLFLLLVLFFTVRPIVNGLMVMSHLVVGLILISGALWFTHVELNILNISAISIILGTGIDSFIHFDQRYTETGDMGETLKSKIPAILVANLTSIVGLGGLCLTASPGIRSIGWLAVIGLAIVTFLAVFVFPRTLQLLKRS